MNQNLISACKHLLQLEQSPEFKAALLEFVKNYEHSNKKLSASFFEAKINEYIERNKYEQH